MNNKALGKLGEDLAEEYLLNNGYRIITRNYSNRIGEIDIVASFKDILIFLEVKSRRNKLYGNASEAVNRTKQRKIINTSLIYISEKNLSNWQIRYDIVEIYLGKEVIINHIENAFNGF